MTIISKAFRDDAFEVLQLVDAEHHELRLDQFTALYLESFSREVIKRKIKDKEIIIIGRPGVHKPSSSVHHLDHVLIKFFKSSLEDEFWKGQKLALQEVPDVVYEDDDLLVISKPAFMSTHPAGRHIFNCATSFFERKYKQTIHSLHRIDRETSGILMLGKNPAMATEMMERFESDDVKKCYLFIGRIQAHFKHQDTFEANERMGSPGEGLKRIAVESYPQDSLEGKSARTFFKILKKNEKYVIGLAYPQTGRQHQIRVHAKVHGVPLIGDKLYLGSYETFQRFKDHQASRDDHELMELSRHALHAIGLKIPYKNNPGKIFITKIPQDLSEWIAREMKIDIALLEQEIEDAVITYFSQSSTGN